MTDGPDNTSTDVTASSTTTNAICPEADQSTATDVTAAENDTSAANDSSDVSPIAPLPPGWSQCRHNSGLLLYVHQESKAVCVTKPYSLQEVASPHIKDHRIPEIAFPNSEMVKIMTDADNEIFTKEEEKALAEAPFTYTYFPPEHLESITVCTVMEISVGGVRHATILRRFCEKAFPDDQLDVDVVEGPEKVDKSLAEYTVVVRVGRHILGGGMGNTWELAFHNAVAEALCYVLPSETAKWRDIDASAVSDFDKHCVAPVAMRRLDPACNFNNDMTINPRGLLPIQCLFVYSKYLCGSCMPYFAINRQLMFFECAVKVRGIQFSYARDKSGPDVVDLAADQAVKVLIPDLERWVHNMGLLPAVQKHSEDTLEAAKAPIKDNFDAGEFSKAWREAERIKTELRFAHTACMRMVPPPKPLYDRLEGMRRVITKRVADLENQMSIIRLKYQSDEPAAPPAAPPAPTADDMVMQGLQELRATADKSDTEKDSAAKPGEAKSAPPARQPILLAEARKGDQPEPFSTMPAAFDDVTPPPPKLLEAYLHKRDGTAPELLKDEHKQAKSDFGDYTLTVAGYTVRLSWTKDHKEAKERCCSIILSNLFPNVKDYNQLAKYIQEYVKNGKPVEDLMANIPRKQNTSVPDKSDEIKAGKKDSPSKTEPAAPPVDKPADVKVVSKPPVVKAEPKKEVNVNTEEVANSQEKPTVPENMTPDEAIGMLMQTPLDEEKYSSIFEICKHAKGLDPLSLLEDYLKLESKKPGRQWDEDYSAPREGQGRGSFLMMTRYRRPDKTGPNSLIEVEVTEKSEKRCRRKACIKMIAAIFPEAKTYGEVIGIVGKLKQSMEEARRLLGVDEEYVSTFREMREREARACAAYPDKAPSKKRSRSRSREKSDRRRSRDDSRRRSPPSPGRASWLGDQPKSGRRDHWQHDDRAGRPKRDVTRGGERPARRESQPGADRPPAYPADRPTMHADRVKTPRQEPRKPALRSQVAAAYDSPPRRYASPPRYRTPPRGYTPPPPQYESRDYTPPRGRGYAEGPRWDSWGYSPGERYPEHGEYSPPRQGEYYGGGGSDGRWEEEEAAYDGRTDFGGSQSPAEDERRAAGKKHRKRRSSSPSRSKHKKKKKRMRSPGGAEDEHCGVFDKVTVDQSEEHGGWVRASAGELMVYHSLASGEYGVCARGEKLHKKHRAEHDRLVSMDDYELGLFRQVMAKMEAHVMFYRERAAKRSG